MAYNMKGSPFQRNFGIGSPAKQNKANKGNATTKTGDGKVNVYSTKFNQPNITAEPGTNFAFIKGKTKDGKVSDTKVVEAKKITVDDFTR